MTTPQGKPISLSKEDMKRKFDECGMPELLKLCLRKLADRDPNLLTIYPHTSVKHKREHGYWYVTSDGEPIALIYYWEGTDNEPQESIRPFTCPNGQIYKLKLAEIHDLTQKVQ
jgi:hypothetical protein